MKVCFLLVDDAKVGGEPAKVMVAQVKRHMPHVEIVQLTGKHDPVIDGCTVRRIDRRDEPLMLYRLRHLMEMGNTELICLDTDIVVQQDISKLFAFPFDVALTWRDGPIYMAEDKERKHDITKDMPINAGVMLSRTARFWKDCFDMLSVQSAEMKRWFGDQIAIAKVAKEYNVLRLHCDNWNRTPGSSDEDVSTAYAVHYKGIRKQWMVDRYGAR